VDLTHQALFSRRTHTENETLLRPPVIQFFGPDKLLLSFDDNSDFESRPFQFHVLEFNTADGTLIHSLSRNVTSNNSKTLPVGDGIVMLINNESIEKVSANLDITEPLFSKITQPLNEEVARKHDRRKHFDISVSPSGKQLLLATIDFPKVTLYWFDSHSFQQIGSASVTSLGAPMFDTGDNFAIVWGVWGQKTLIASPNFATRPIHDQAHLAGMIDDKRALMTTTFKKPIEIFRIQDGVTLQTLAIPYVSTFSSAPIAGRVAVESSVFKGSGFPLQTHFTPHMTVTVVELNSKKEVANLKFDKQEVRPGELSTGFNQTAIALSPDGKRLAVVVDYQLLMYELP